jgi:hypothetical protein
LLLPLDLISKDNGKNKRPIMAKTQGAQIVTTRMDINNLNALEANNGFSDYNTNSNLEGTEYPKGSGKTAVFQSGFLWGGYIPGDSQVRVGGSAYRTGLQPGPIVNGVAADPTDAKYSIYRVRPDVYPGGPKVDLSSDAALEGVSEAALRAQYEADWTNWPAAGTGNDLAAPFKDVNGDGKYEPGTDIPGVPGADQTIYYVANDLNSGNTTNLYGTAPIGIEVHATFWAYAQSGALGNIYFKKWNIINKGSNTVDSMFVSFWADVDLGTATDDLVGCDTTLSLQFTYNGNPTDAVYTPLPPPADGFDFFEGPVVAGEATDSAIFKGSIVYGKKNLPMTAAYFFINNDANFNDPTQGDPAGATQFYHFFNGEYGLTGAPFTDNKNNETKFAFYGDPVTGTGWLDGVTSAPGDRRQGMASGPFTMAPGDTQEVVVAEIFAGATTGVDYHSAINLLKFYDKTAQSSYNNFFQIPTAPPAPQVSVVNLSNKVVLDWGENLTAVQATENYGSLGYKFEGYNVFQLPPPNSTASSVLLATYDVAGDNILKILDDYFDATSGEVTSKVYEFGTDSGIKRSITITTDQVMNVGKALNNGSKYYFAVTAYAYNATSIPHHLENPISSITAIPQSSAPGVRSTYATGDTIIAAHSKGTSDGSVIVLVVDPTKLTGDQYKVAFDTAGGINTWKLIDVTKSNSVVLSGQTNQTGDDNYSFVSGMQVKVIGPNPGMNTYNIPSGKRDWTFSGADGFGLEGFSGAIGMGYNSWYSSSSITPDQLHKVLIKFAAIDTAYNIVNSSDPNVSSAYRYLRHASSAAQDPSFVPFIINPTAGYAYQDRRSVPFAAYDEDNNNKRLDVGFLENNVAGGRVDGKYDPPSSNDGIDNTDASYTREWFFIFGTNYSTSDNSALATDVSDNETPLMWWGTPNMRAANLFAAGDEFEIVPNYVNSLKDEFTFTATASTKSTALAKVDINLINVFPNPYYGVNTQETSKYARFVTFNHLPATATIRIFNLAGILVRTINHTDGTQFQQWDLNNDSGLPVASGLYIVYIDMPTIGATKILKTAIIQEQQFPDHF